MRSSEREKLKEVKKELEEVLPLTDEVRELLNKVVRRGKQTAETTERFTELCNAIHSKLRKAKHTISEILGWEKYWEELLK